MLLSVAGKEQNWGDGKGNEKGYGYKSCTVTYDDAEVSPKVVHL